MLVEWDEGLPIAVDPLCDAYDVLVGDEVLEMAVGRRMEDAAPAVLAVVLRSPSYGGDPLKPLGDECTHSRTRSLNDGIDDRGGTEGDHLCFGKKLFHGDAQPTQSGLDGGYVAFVER